MKRCAEFDGNMEHSAANRNWDTHLNPPIFACRVTTAPPPRKFLVAEIC